MNLSADEFLSLSTQLSDRDVRVVELEKQLEETKRLLLVKEGEVVALTQRLAEAEQIQQATEIENRYLKQYLWLSWTKIKHFMTRIHDIRLVAFLQTFMLKTVSENMGARALEAINEVVSLPDEEEKPSTNIQAEQVIMQNHGTVNAPCAQRNRPYCALSFLKPRLLRNNPGFLPNKRRLFQPPKRLLKRLKKWRKYLVV